MQNRFSGGVPGPGDGPYDSGQAFAYDRKGRAWSNFGGAPKFDEMTGKSYRLKGGKRVEVR